MKKVLKTIVCLFGIAVLIVLFAACTKNDKKIYDSITNQMESKYGEINYEVESIVKLKEYSGRYEAYVKDTENNIEFEIFVYPTYTTDSYSVLYANKRMDTLLKKLIADVRKADYLKQFDTDSDEITPTAEQKAFVPEVYIESITWLNKYGDDGSTFEFIEVKNYKTVAVTDVTAIDTITFKKTVNDPEKIAAYIKTTISALSLKNINLDAVKFKFVYEGKEVTIPAKTSAEYKKMTAEQIKTLFVKPEEKTIINK